MKRALLGGVAALLAASSPAAAQIDRSAELAPTSRFVAGASISGARGDLASSTPQGGGQYDRAINFGVSAGFERRLGDHAWLGGYAGTAAWSDGSGVDAGYLYRRLDLGVAPRLEAYRRSARVLTWSIDLALPIGVTRPFVTVPQRRAFDETVDSRWGWYVGGTASFTMLFRLGRKPSAPSIGFRIELGYVRHASRRRTTFTPADPSQAPAVEDIQVVDNEDPLTVAFVAAF